ncbi:hypothetical protein MHC_04570 [Mycoplasma haemocanis str. Illinois]|uniref:Uncharacterized protein n=1 Tax=Mycoplasma haemocanis (strain Illinois) TaxID=1111676 RepID=H6N7Z8_MYCHN|nr:hypothetical protein [Mycoplasma haemocanis]AEW45770.1 hypothetical protein MHC_04570 [Mycoplasma haemocanis str. Illinois]
MKLGVVVASIGGAGVAAVGGYHYWPSNSVFISIKDALKDSRLISDLPQASLVKQWQEEFKSAKGDIAKDIEELKGVTEDVDGGKKLEAWCSSKMNLDSKKNGDTLKLVKKYCLIRDLSSQLKRTNKSLLDKSQSGEWEAVYKKRQEGKSVRADVGLSDTNWPESKQSEELSTIQKWCEDTSKEDFLASNEKYNKLLKWCTVDGKNLT